MDHLRHAYRLSRALVAFAWVLSVAAPGSAAQVVTVRAGDHPEFTRVVFELDAATGYKVERAGTDERPVLRVSVDAASRDYSLRATGDVRGVRVQSGPQAVAEIALTKSGLQLKEMILSKPYRIVLDVMKAPKAVASAVPAPAPRTAAVTKPAPGKATPAPKPAAEPAPQPEVVARTTTPKASAPVAPVPAPKASAPVAPVPAPKASPVPGPVARTETPAPDAKSPAQTKPAPPVKPVPAVKPAPTPAPAHEEPEPAKTAQAAPTPAAKPEPVVPPAIVPAPPKPSDEPKTLARAETPAPSDRLVEPMAGDAGARDLAPAIEPVPHPPEAMAKAPPASPVRPSEPAIRKPTALPPAPATAPSWSDRLTREPRWLAGLAAALIGLVAIVFALRRRRRALPNDLDVTAIAEEVEQSSRQDSEGFDFGRTEVAPASPSSDESSFAGLFDDEAGEAAAPEPATRPAAAAPMFAPSASSPADEGDASSLFDDAGGVVGQDTPHGDVPMNQDMDLPADPNRTVPRMGGSAAYDAEPPSDMMRMFQDLERRISTLEAKLDEANESREKLERQVAAQSEELRVQRAAIARTQRALRTMSRADEDKATEPALRDGDTQAKTRVNV